MHWYIFLHQDYTRLQSSFARVSDLSVDTLFLLPLSRSTRSSAIWDLDCLRYGTRVASAVGTWSPLLRGIFVALVSRLRSLSPQLVASAMGPLSLQLVISATWDFVVVAIGPWLLSPLWDLGRFYNVGPLLPLYMGHGCLRYGILITPAGCFNYVKPWSLPPLRCVS